MMDDELDVLQRLTAVPELLASIPVERVHEMKLQAELRKKFDPELVRTALTLVELRNRAKAKFTRAAELWLDRASLEQATAESIARHKAKRFSDSETPVLDLFSGMGSNAIGLALEGRNVIAVETTELQATRVRMNAAAYGVSDRIQASVEENPLALAGESLLHLQPRRELGKQRAVKLEDHQPALDELKALIDVTPGGAFTLSSASNFGGKFDGCEAELISLNGDCLEAVIWYGSLRKEHAMTATILPAGWTMSGNPWEAYAQVGPLGTYLYDPDSAVVRAGLLNQLAESLQLDRLDGAEEYLSGNELISSPAVTPYEVIADLPNNDRDIRNYFRQSEIGELEIRCRHVPVDAAALRRKLPLSGREKAVLFYAKLDGKTRALIARRVDQQPS